MANILTAAEAANFIRTDASDAVMLMLLPLVDKFIQRATGRDWTADSPINDIAKATAGMLLVCWYDNPAQATNEAVPFGLQSVLAQLEAEALNYRTYQFRGISSPGYIGLPGARLGDRVISLTGVYGVTGDQSSKFESSVQYQGSLKQTSTDNLYPNLYVVILKSPGDDVYP